LRESGRLQSPDKKGGLRSWRKSPLPPGKILPALAREEGPFLIRRADTANASLKTLESEEIFL